MKCEKCIASVLYFVECFVFCSMFRKSTRKMRKVNSQPYSIEASDVITEHRITSYGFPCLFTSEWAHLGFYTSCWETQHIVVCRDFLEFAPNDRLIKKSNFLQKLKKMKNRKTDEWKEKNIDTDKRCDAIRLPLILLCRKKQGQRRKSVKFYRRDNILKQFTTRCHGFNTAFKLNISGGFLFYFFFFFFGFF